MIFKLFNPTCGENQIFIYYNTFFYYKMIIFTITIIFFRLPSMPGHIFKWTETIVYNKN